MLKPFTRYVCIISFKLYKRFEEGDLLQPGCTPQSTGELLEMPRSGQTAGKLNQNLWEWVGHEYF